METFRLISMTDFVTQEWEKDLYTDDFAKIVKNYSDFLKQPLKLEMFVPCDEDGNVLEEPNDYFPEGIESDYSKKYQQAKEKVLFEGFDIIEISKNLRIVKNQNKDCQVFANQVQNVYYKCIGFDIIEDLVKYNLTLTPNAIKQLGL